MECLRIALERTPKLVVGFGQDEAPATSKGAGKAPRRHNAKTRPESSRLLYTARSLESKNGNTVHKT